MEDICLLFSLTVVCLFQLFRLIECYIIKRREKGYRLQCRHVSKFMFQNILHYEDLIVKLLGTVQVLVDRPVSRDFVGARWLCLLVLARCRVCCSIADFRLAAGYGRYRSALCFGW